MRQLSLPGPNGGAYLASRNGSVMMDGVYISHNVGQAAWVLVRVPAEVQKPGAFVNATKLSWNVVSSERISKVA